MQLGIYIMVELIWLKVKCIKKYLSANSFLNKTIHEINLQFENAKSNLKLQLIT